MGTHVTETQNCPECGTELNRATNSDDKTSEPTEGDFTICYKCGTPLVFNETLSQIKISDDAMLQLEEEDPDTYEYIMQVCDIIKQRNHEE